MPQVAGYMSEISTASREQSEGIEQVNQAIMQMDDITQQNATVVEQAAATAENMEGQAIKLTQLVNNFKLVSGGQASTGGKVLSVGKHSAVKRQATIVTKIAAKSRPSRVASSRSMRDAAPTRRLPAVAPTVAAGIE